MISPNKLIFLETTIILENLELNNPYLFIFFSNTVNILFPCMNV